MGRYRICPQVYLGVPWLNAYVGLGVIIETISHKKATVASHLKRHRVCLLAIFYGSMPADDAVNEHLSRR